MAEKAVTRARLKQARARKNMAVRRMIRMSVLLDMLPRVLEQTKQRAPWVYDLNIMVQLRRSKTLWYGRVAHARRRPFVTHTDNGVV